MISLIKRASTREDSGSLSQRLQVRSRLNIDSRAVSSLLWPIYFLAVLFSLSVYKCAQTCVHQHFKVASTLLTNNFKCTLNIQYLHSFHITQIFYFEVSLLLVWFSMIIVIYSLILISIIIFILIFLFLLSLLQVNGKCDIYLLYCKWYYICSTSCLHHTSLRIDFPSSF